MGIKRLIYRSLLKAGYELRPVWNDWRRLPRISPDIGTIIDIGVGHGTPYLYDGFPDADLILVEPLSQFEPDMRRILRLRNGTYYVTALGSHEGVASISVTSDPQRSSLSKPSSWRREVVQETRTIPITTLDSLISRVRPSPPLLLKIDTEGHEIDVIQGGTRALDDTACVVAEISVTERFEGGYRLADFVSLMDSNGFGLADLLTIARRDGRVTFIDGVFLPYSTLDGLNG